MWAHALCFRTRNKVIEVASAHAAVFSHVTLHVNRHGNVSMWTNSCAKSSAFVCAGAFLAYSFWTRGRATVARAVNAIGHGSWVHLADSCHCDSTLRTAASHFSFVLLSSLLPLALPVIFLLRREKKKMGFEKEISSLLPCELSEGDSFSFAASRSICRLPLGKSGTCPPTTRRWCPCVCVCVRCAFVQPIDNSLYGQITLSNSMYFQRII